MTIQFLNAWNGYEQMQVVSTLSAAEETRLISLGLARNFVAGSTDAQSGRNAILTAAQVAAGATSPVGVTPSGQQVLPDGRLLDAIQAGRTVGYDGDQPAAITRAVTNMGRLACRFGAGQWTASVGAPVLTQGHTGWDGSGNRNGVTSVTGQPDMLKVVPAANSTERISLGSFATNMLTKALGGRFGLWVYVESQPGYQVGGTPAGTIGIEVGTDPGQSNQLYVAFSPQQIREGWNFLKFVMRDPAAYVDGSSVTEYHPFGIAALNYGTGANTNIRDNAAAFIHIQWDNMLGATLYFDSIWTGFQSRAQFVLGCDQGANFSTLALPLFQQYGWTGYVAFPYNTANTGTSTSTVQTDPSAVQLAEAAAAYALGWDVINHTMTHPSLGGMSAEGNIAYQVSAAKAWLIEQGFIRGSEFYASPQSSTSRLSEKVIKSLGFRLQRHSRKGNTPITAFGIDNPHHVGSIDMGVAGAGGLATVTSGTNGTVTGWQTATKLKRYIDVIEAYGDTGQMYWHGITTSGDTGSGEDATGSDLLITRSAFEQVMAYLRQREQAGAVEVCRGLSGWYYGSAA